MLKKLIKIINKYVERQNIAKQLYAMSDKELADIGITRGMIPTIIRDV
jgi:uncharacterized protein YjiS (DUF1127 family)